VKEAWGSPSGGGKARIGRQGRQAKRCPNWRTEGNEKIIEIAGLESVKSSESGLQRNEIECLKTSGRSTLKLIGRV